MPRKLVSKYRAGSYSVETWEWPSTTLGVDKRVSVLVPGGCATGVPVLYLLHGFGGSRETWLSRTRLLEHLDGTGLMVVLPESGRRWFINDHRGFRYEDYLQGELLPFVEDTYAVHVGPGRRAIGGFSMGGAAALMQALRHPGTYGVVVSHAGAFEAPLREGDPYRQLRGARDLAIPSVEAHERVWGPVGSVVRRRYDPHALLAALPAGPRPVVYVDVGTEDYPRITAMNRRMAGALRRAGVVTEYHERPGAHDLTFLDHALPRSLQFVDDQLRRN
ncbi:alpha/beta hydrolase [Streptomyces apocyni]|uniref:alpha/beta hydrolase n=1 Tax=Streptomyces apocyni TaxID=2654677 RepID=UPI001E59C13C|nr:alpha/beta fold hydrolase [Streptomyces apocyni]